MLKETNQKIAHLSVIKAQNVKEKVFKNLTLEFGHIKYQLALIIRIIETKVQQMKSRPSNQT